MQTTNKIITPDLIEKSLSYPEYWKLINHKLAQEKTTGPKQSEALVKYTKLNVQRMKRLDKTVQLNESLEAKLNEVEASWTWLVLTEGWCGDAAQNVPVLNKMAEVSSNIELRFILRDSNLDIMDQYLTNGGRSIPKLICLNAETLEEIGTWGPRPEQLQEKAMDWKDDPALSKKEWAEKLHTWYAKNRSEAIQADFEALIEEWQ